MVLENATRIIGALVFFCLGVSWLLFFLLLKDWRPIVLSIPAFVLSGLFVSFSVQIVRPMVSYAEMVVAVRIALIILGTAYTADNIFRLLLRYKFRDDIRRLATAYNPSIDGFDIGRLIEILAEIGWIRRYGGITGFDGTVSGRE
jgi:hypothetical protein